MNKLRLTEKKRGIRNMGGPYRFAHLAPAALAVLLCAVFWRVLVWPTLSAAEAPMSGNLFHYAPTLASALGLVFLVAFSWKAHRYLDRLRSKRNKQAESLDSGNLLSTVLKNVPDVIYRLDPGGRIVFISDSVRRFGYEPERLVGRHILDLVHPDDVETARYRLNERRTGERGTKALEVRILTKDKDVRQVESRCVAVISVSAEGLYGASLPGADSFLGTQGIARDLTRQKIAEQALAESEAKYRQLYYHAPAGIYEVDIKNACFLTVNDLMCEYTGYSREEFFRLNPIDILTEESLVTFIERINKLKAGENVPADFEVQIKGKNGRVFWVLIHVRYTYEDGVPVRAAVVVHDTTARKEAELALKRSEKALRESEERYRSILENSADGFFMARISDGALVFVNSVLCDLFGYDAEEALKHTIYDFIDPEDHKIINDRVRLRLTGQRPSPARWTYRAIRRDRSVFKAEITVTLVTYNGEPMAQGTLRDVTEQETLQRQLQHSQKMNAVGTLAGGIAHDFNNIIQAIQGYAELIRLKSDPDSDVCQQSRAIEAGAERASELARRLLAFSQKMESQARPIDVNRQVEQVVKLMSRTIPKMIDIEAVPAADLWSAQADPVQVEQVIMNLLVNARDAMPEGGVIVIQTGNVELDELFCRRHIGVREGRYVRLTVGRHGPGHGPGNNGAHLRTVFHHQGPGRWNGPRFVHSLWHRQKTRRAPDLPQPTRRGNGFPRLSAGRGPVVRRRGFAGPPEHPPRTGHGNCSAG